MGVFNDLGKTLEVESRRLHHMPVVVGMANEARERTLQDVQVSRGPLDVGQRLRVARLVKIEPFSAHERETKISEQFLVMRLADAVEIDDLPIKIIQNLNFGRLLLKEHLGSARECLHIRRMLRKNFNDLLGETVLSSYI